MTDLAQTLTDRAVSASAAGTPGRRRRVGRVLTVLIPVAVLVVLFFLPWMGFSIPGVLPGPVNSPGSMQLLALCLVTAGIALSYDVLFGRTGLLSFGHALFVGAGAYGAAIALGKWGAGLGVAVLFVLAPRHRPAAAGRGDLVAGQGHCLRDGDAGLRAGGGDHRAAQSRRADRRRGGAVAEPGQPAVIPVRGGERALPLLAGAGVLRVLRAGGGLAGRGPDRSCLGRGAGERGSGRGARAVRVPGQADGDGGRRLPRHHRRFRPADHRRRGQPAPAVHRADAVIAGDGGAGRGRQSLGSADRRGAVRVAGQPVAGTLHLRDHRRTARRAAGAAEPAGVRAGPAVRAGGLFRARRDRRHRRSGAGGPGSAEGLRPGGAWLPAAGDGGGGQNPG